MVEKSNDEEKEKKVFEDILTEGLGTRAFLIIQAVVLVTYLILNVVPLIFHWDPYPFILLNLFLSFQAAFTGPIVLISQNRQTERDRVKMQTLVHLASTSAFLLSAHKEELQAHKELLTQVLQTNNKMVDEIVDELETIIKDTHSHNADEAESK